jgi:hydrogenase maturation factor
VLGEVAPNDLVLVHAGTAIARLDDSAEEVDR